MTTIHTLNQRFNVFPKRPLFFVMALFSSFLGLPQSWFIEAPLLRAQRYSLNQLTQEPVKITARPLPDSPLESRDTSYTKYAGSSVEFSIYTLNGPQWHVHLNPAPTGIVINGQSFRFYCSTELGVPMNLSSFLDIYEFEYLGRKYLCLFTLQEDCLYKGCRFKCYNLYDITDPKKIVPYSFSTIFEGSASFGDFNFDGKMDIITAMPKAPNSYLESAVDDKGSNVLITAYTLDKGKMRKLIQEQKSGNPYYIYVKPQDEELSSFEVLQTDWFIPLKDPSGKVLEPKSFYPDYTPFDPKNDFLYTPEGYRVDKRRWVIQLEDFPDEDGAIDYCEELRAKGFQEVFIKVDHYGPDFLFRVFYGNYWSKEKAQQMHQLLIEKKLLERNKPDAIMALQRD
jgi:hypothetical protein